jgi:hypothetical protein
MFKATKQGTKLITYYVMFETFLMRFKCKLD